MDFLVIFNVTMIDCKYYDYDYLNLPHTSTRDLYPQTSTRHTLDFKNRGRPLFLWHKIWLNLRQTPTLTWNTLSLNGSSLETIKDSLTTYSPFLVPRFSESYGLAFSLYCHPANKYSATYRPKCCSATLYPSSSLSLVTPYNDPSTLEDFLKEPYHPVEKIPISNTDSFANLQTLKGPTIRIYEVLDVKMRLFSDNLVRLGLIGQIMKSPTNYTKIKALLIHSSLMSYGSWFARSKRRC